MHIHIYVHVYTTYVHVYTVLSLSLSLYIYIYTYVINMYIHIYIYIYICYDANCCIMFVNPCLHPVLYHVLFIPNCVNCVFVSVICFMRSLMVKQALAGGERSHHLLRTVF